MSEWYSLDGSLSVKDSPEIQNLVDLYNKIDIEFYAQYLGVTDGISGVVEFSGGNHVSHQTVEKIDNAVKAFAPFVVEPQFIAYIYASDRGDLYVGPENMEKVLESKQAFNDIADLIGKLEPTERTKLIDILTKME